MMREKGRSLKKLIKVKISSDRDVERYIMQGVIMSG